MGLFENKDEYLAKLQEQFDELDQTIANWEEKGKEASGAAQEKFDQKLEEMKGLREDLESNMDQLRIATEDSWNEIKENMESTLSSVSSIAMDSFGKLKDFFK